MADLNPSIELILKGLSLLGSRFDELDEMEEKISIEKFKGEFGFLDEAADKFKLLIEKFSSLNSRIIIFCGGYFTENSPEANTKKEEANTRNNIKNNLL